MDKFSGFALLGFGFRMRVLIWAGFRSVLVSSCMCLVSSKAFSTESPNRNVFFVYFFITDFFLPSLNSFFSVVAIFSSSLIWLTYDDSITIFINMFWLRLINT